MRLFDWGPSPFCMKVRAVLDHKRIDYERVMVLGTPIVELWRRGQIGKVPALDIDGALFCDSTDIAYELERRYPTPAILPPTPRERALCHALEEWADESIYFVGLYFQWCDPEAAPMVKQFFRTVPVIGGVAYPLYARVIRRQVREQGTGRKPRAHIAADLERHLDAIEAMIDGRQFLLGDAPLLCDFAMWAQVQYLRRTPHGGRALAKREAITHYLDRVRALRRSPGT